MEQIKPDFYLWLGDNPSHDIWNQFPNNHSETARFISEQFVNRKYGMRGKVYPALGNHEGYPSDSFDVDNRSNDWVLNETSEMWKQWFDDEGTY